MKLKLTLLFAIIIFSKNIFALDPNHIRAFAVGDQTISAGIGAGAIWEEAFNKYRPEAGYKPSISGPFYLKYENAMIYRIGFGVNLAYYNTQADWNYPYQNADRTKGIDEVTLKHTSFSIIVRGNFHYFPSNERLDVYSGIGVGYRSGSYQWSESANGKYPIDNLKNRTPLAVDVTSGIRYFITPQIGAYLELGLAKSFAQAGFTVKF